MARAWYCLLAFALANLLHAAIVERQLVRSDSKVKASASASKIDGDGKQIVTVTLDIQKGWLLYANPVKFTFGDGKMDSEFVTFFKMNRTQVFVEPKEKVTYLARYPSGKTKVDGKDRFSVYEGRVVIPVHLERMPGEASPLRIKIHVQAVDVDFRGPCQHQIGRASCRERV